MRVLVTTARMPFALGLIRRLGEAGHEVLASDTYEVAPGAHSRDVSRHFATPAPRLDPAGFVSEVGRIAVEEGVDTIAPSWEDVFYLSALRQPGARLHRPDLGRLRGLARRHRDHRVQPPARPTGSCSWSPSSLPAAS